MGQSLKKLTPAAGSEQKEQLIEEILKRHYQAHFGDDPEKTSPAKFYAAIFHAVEEMNKHLGYTQVRAPNKEELERLFNTHHKDKSNPLRKEEFQSIVREISSSTQLTGIGFTDTLLYMFGVPLTTVFLKNKVMPGAISNDVFIPAVTSLTAFFLATFNKI